MVSSWSQTLEAFPQRLRLYPSLCLLLFIQNISPILIGSKPRAISSYQQHLTKLSSPLSFEISNQMMTSIHHNKFQKKKPTKKPWEQVCSVVLLELIELNNKTAHRTHNNMVSWFIPLQPNSQNSH